jgi:hypothetical protein
MLPEELPVRLVFGQIEFQSHWITMAAKASADDLPPAKSLTVI